MDEEPAFTTNTWGGLRRWACARCPWDTLDGEDAMRAHIAERHTTVIADPREVEIKQDRFGNPVNAPGVEVNDDENPT
jgi:hypothetical protein